MVRSQLDDAVTEVFEKVTDCTFAEVGYAFLAYLVEAEHQGWEGTPSKDKAAIARFLADLQYSFDPRDLRTDYLYTGSRYITKDGRPENETLPTAKERANFNKRMALPIKEVE